MEATQDTKLQLSSKVRGLEREVERLEKQGARAAETLELREKQIASLKSDLMIAREERDAKVGELARDGSNASELIRALDLRVDELSCGGKNLESLVASLRNETMSLAVQLDREIAAHKQTSCLLREANEITARNNEDMRGLSQQHDADLKQLMLLSSELKVCVSEKTSANDELQRSSEQLQAFAAESKLLNQQLSEVKERSRALEQRLIKAESGCEELVRTQGEMRQLQQTFDSLRLKHESLDTEHHKVVGQLEGTKLFCGDLENTVGVMKQALQDRRDELFSKHKELQDLQEKHAELEQLCTRYRHRINEAERERAELLRLREVAADQGGAVDALEQEHKILIDQVSATEELNAALEDKAKALEERVAQLSGSKETVDFLTQSQSRLEEELSRTQKLLMAKTEEALAGVAAQENLSALTSRVEQLSSELAARENQHRCELDDVNQQLREQVELYESAIGTASELSRDIQRIEDELHREKDSSRQIPLLQREVASLRSESVRQEHEILQLNEEKSALEKRLSATGPLAQAEMEASLSQLEGTIESQEKALKDYALQCDMLQETIRKDQSMISSLISNGRVPVDNIELLRELSDARGKMMTLESNTSTQANTIVQLERTAADLRHRLKLLEVMVGRGQGQEYISRAPSFTPRDSRGPSVQPEGDGTINVAGDDGLVPTPMPTPRLMVPTFVPPTAGGAMMALASAQRRPANPAAVRSYVEHLSNSLDRSTAHNAQLQRELMQQSETTRVLMDRIARLRTSLLSPSATATATPLAALIDEVTSYLVANLQLSLAASRARNESLVLELQAAKQERASLTLQARNDGEDNRLGTLDMAQALTDVQHLLEEKTSLISQLRRERDAAKCEVSSKSRTIAALVEHITAQSQPTSRSNIEVAFLAQSNTDLKAKIQELHTTIGELEALHESGNNTISGRDRTTASLLDAEHRLNAQAEVISHQAQELSSVHLELAQQKQVVHNYESVVEEKKRELADASSKHSELERQIQALQTTLHEKEAALTQQATLLNVRRERKEELVAWLQGVPDTRSFATALATHETFDELTVCKQLHLMFQHAQADAKRLVENDKSDEYQRLLKEARGAESLAQERVSQLTHDVQSLVDDIEACKRSLEEERALRRVEAEEKAALHGDIHVSRTEMECERRTVQDLRTTIAQLIAANVAKEGVVDALEQRIETLETKYRDADAEVEVKIVELHSKETLLRASKKELASLHEIVKEKDQLIAKHSAQVDELNHKLSIAAQDSASLRLHAAEVEGLVASQNDAIAREHQSHAQTKESLEAKVAQLRLDIARIPQLQDEVRSSKEKVESLLREQVSMNKRLALAQELNNHLKEQNAVLEKHRVDTANIRSRIGVATSDANHLKRLCVDVFGVLPVDADESTSTGYVMALESYAAKVRDDQKILRDVQECMDNMYKDLVAARKASHHIGIPTSEERASLSLSPSAHGGDHDESFPAALTSTSTGGESRSGSPGAAPIVRPPTSSEIRSWMDRLAAANKAVCIQHWNLVDTIRAHRSKVIQLTDQNKRLAEDNESLSGSLKQAASRMLRSDTAEQQLSFFEPSRDIALRTLFHLRDTIHDLKIRTSLISGTVSQTKEHWRELYNQLTNELEPMKGLLQQAQSQLTFAFDRCLTQQEREEIAQQDPSVRNNPMSLVTPRKVGEETFDGLRTVLPGAVLSTPVNPTKSAAILGLDSTAHRDVVRRGVEEARRREQMRHDTER